MQKYTNYSQMVTKFLRIPSGRAVRTHRNHLKTQQKRKSWRDQTEADAQPFTGHAGDDIIIHAGAESSMKKEHEQHDV